ncbi:hypothetical protein B0H15DRAFT_957603 [Mycena belliarum]|uniref:Uncharacterized protein n=1 Tax=Mycena belliarum TaxID=1033014 RepID=A0AAD6TM46_9AGAR|nr:hypothetical protein B0H15DRAFT_957603 [Mycena belliae]
MRSSDVAPVTQHRRPPVNLWSAHPYTYAAASPQVHVYAHVADPGNLKGVLSLLKTPHRAASRLRHYQHWIRRARPAVRISGFAHRPPRRLCVKPLEGPVSLRSFRRSGAHPTRCMDSRTAVPHPPPLYLLAERTTGADLARRRDTAIRAAGTCADRWAGSASHLRARRGVDLLRFNLLAPARCSTLRIRGEAGLALWHQSAAFGFGRAHRYASSDN